MKRCSGIEKQLKATSKKPEEQVQVSLENTAVCVPAVFSLVNKEIVSHWHARWGEDIYEKDERAKACHNSNGSKLSQSFGRFHLLADS